MDVFSSGPNTGNLLVTVGLVGLLLVLSSRAKMLDTKGANAAAVLGLIVGGLGHWTWLLILLGFLLSSHKATKWRFDEKKTLGLSESSDGHRGWTNVVANGAIPGLICIYAYMSDDWDTVVWMFGAAVAVQRCGGSRPHRRWSRALDVVAHPARIFVEFTQGHQVAV